MNKIITTVLCATMAVCNTLKAQETMKDVRHAMRIDYFNEEGLF